MNMFARFDENQQWLFELLRKQSVTDGRTDARTNGRTDGRTDNVKTVYPLQTKFAGGIKIVQLDVKFQHKQFNAHFFVYWTCMNEDFYIQGSILLITDCISLGGTTCWPYWWRVRSPYSQCIWWLFMSLGIRIRKSLPGRSWWNQISVPRLLS